MASEPELVSGDGDGTVNIKSLKGCLNFRTAQNQQVSDRCRPRQETYQELQSTTEYLIFQF